VTGARSMPTRLTRLSRRRLLLGAGAAAGVGAIAGAGIHEALGAGEAAVPDVPPGPQPAGLPARQHAWEAYLMVDSHGNPVPPRFSRLLFFDVNGGPTPAYARLLEAALRTLERGYPWRSSGLLFTAAWGPAYFTDVLGMPSPVPPATALSAFEQPAFDDYHLCLHLASDDEARLAAIEAALTRGAPLPDAAADRRLDVSSVLRLRQSRTGFVGTGLPAGRQDVSGIPDGRPVAPDSPLYMGFRSGLRRNQASEDDVTITGGPFAGGTTMHVSYLRLRLGTWYGQLSQRERVARMYAPQVTPEQASEFSTDAESDPGQLGQAITRYGVIGHAQASARARRGGRPVILRRDFDTTDGGLAGLHFVSLQRAVADFTATRTAMNAAGAQLRNPSITDTVNNGINEFIFVLRRGNYIVPSRGQRSFPLLPGREDALALAWRLARPGDRGCLAADGALLDALHHGVVVAGRHNRDHCDDGSRADQRDAVARDNGRRAVAARRRGDKPVAEQGEQRHLRQPQRGPHPPVVLDVGADDQRVPHREDVNDHDEAVREAPYARPDPPPQVIGGAEQEGQVEREDPEVVGPASRGPALLLWNEHARQAVAHRVEDRGDDVDDDQPDHQQ
jgi:dye decolorizing peroxidase